MKNKYLFGDALVTVERIAYNPCASDKYLITVTIGDKSVTEHTFGGSFEFGYDIAERVYNETIHKF